MIRDYEPMRRARLRREKQNRQDDTILLIGAAPLAAVIIAHLFGLFGGM